MSALFELNFASLFAEAILYGLYLATSVHCLRWLLLDDEGLNIRKKISWQMLSITILLFFLMTAAIGINLRLTVRPVFEDNSPVSGGLALVSSGISVTIRLIVDAVLVIRCWVVWEKSWRITCLPLLLWISCLASAIFLIYNDFVSAYGQGAMTVLFAETQQYRCLMLFYTCNIATNIYATSAIVYRIMRATRRSGGQGHLHGICRILIESGVPYTLTSVLVLAASATEVQFRISQEMLQSTSGTINYSIASISFNLILIRVRQSRGRPMHPAPQNAKKTRFPDYDSVPLKTLRRMSTVTTLVNTEQSHDKSTDDGVEKVE